MATSPETSPTPSPGLTRNLLDPHRGWERIKACSGEEKCSGGEMH